MVRRLFDGGVGMSWLKRLFRRGRHRKPRTLKFTMQWR
nr:MAG TPA: hypothetical protein [Caudoviricetes sp.]